MTIFVEGKSDKDFIDSYLNFLDIKNFKLVGVTGKDNLKNNLTLPKLEDKFLIIFDADNDNKTAKENIQNQISEINPQAKYEIFLFPDDENTGDLEILLENIAIKTKYIDCFKKYEECLCKHLSHKSRLYAYVEACGFEPDIKKLKISTLKEIFDLNSNHLTKLKEFLTKNLPEK